MHFWMAPTNEYLVQAHPEAILSAIFINSLTCMDWSTSQEYTNHFSNYELSILFPLLLPDVFVVLELVQGPGNMTNTIMKCTNMQ